MTIDRISDDFQPALDRQKFQVLHGIIGKSVEIRELVDTVMQVAPTDITVLLTGESGTGKEIIAHAIHGASKRSAQKFIAVNCGAIPEGILESELFGHEKGSFTGAVEQRKGYFEIADGGTIFLDEIGDTPIMTQVKLLRVLESGEFMRVGASQPRNADVRIIAATNKDLEQEVRAKRFRQDLYYRLRSVNIRIPPLRARRSDIPVLAEAFLAQARAADPHHTIDLTDDGMAALARHPWPGNVRELRNVIESLLVLEQGRVVDEAVLVKYLPQEYVEQDQRALPMWLGKSPEQMEREMLFAAMVEIKNDLIGIRRMLDHLAGNTERAFPVSGPLPASVPVPAVADAQSRTAPSLDDMTLQDVEKYMLLRTLQRFEGNRRYAAKALGISERTLYRKIHDYGLE